MRQILLSLALLLLVATAISHAPGSAQNPAGTVEQAEQPDLYVLAIGVHLYSRYGGRNPVYAAKDAVDFAASIEQVARSRFGRVEITRLIDGQVTKPAIEEAIKGIISRARPRDSFIFFFSGHGRSSAIGYGGEPQFYLIPSDFSPARDNLNTKAISAVQLQYWFIQIEAQHQLIILDSSKSSGGFQTFQRGFESFEENLEKDNQTLRPVVPRDMGLLSVKGTSFEFASIKNGLLTYVLLQGLGGKAATGNGDITAKSLVDYVEKNTEDILHKVANARARRFMRTRADAGKPYAFFSGNDFVLGPAAPTAAERDNFVTTPVNYFFPPGLVSFTKAAYTTPPAAAVLGQGQQPQSRVPQTTVVVATPTVNSEPPQKRYLPDPRCKSLIETLPSPAANARKGKDLALLIAINEYEHWDHLQNPVFDATSIARELNQHYGFETEVLKNPSSDCITDALYRYALTKKYDDDGQLFIFFAGHGAVLEFFKENGFYIPQEAPAADLSGRKFYDHGTLRQLVNNIPCKHILLVVDSCFSGAIIRDTEQRPELSAEPGDDVGGEVTDDQLFNYCVPRTARLVLTSGGTKYVPDGRKGEHSPFVRKLLGVLKGGSAKHKFLTYTDLLPQMLRVRPKPVPGKWNRNDPESEFFFFQQ